MFGLVFLYIWKYTNGQKVVYIYTLKNGIEWISVAIIPNTAIMENRNKIPTGYWRYDEMDSNFGRVKNTFNNYL